MYLQTHDICSKYYTEKCLFTNAALLIVLTPNAYAFTYKGFSKAVELVDCFICKVIFDMINVRFLWVKYEITLYAETNDMTADFSPIHEN